MFLGTFEPKLDEKGRLILPSKYRDQLRSGLVITRGQENCLVIFPMEEFERIQLQLRQAPTTMMEARSYARVLLSGASDQVPDKQGRITIPAPLRSYANLSRDVAVVGVGNRVEIWDKQAWESYLQVQEDAFSHIENEVISGLF